MTDMDTELDPVTVEESQAVEQTPVKGVPSQTQTPEMTSNEADDAEQIEPEV